MSTNQLISALPVYIACYSYLKTIKKTVISRITVCGLIHRVSYSFNKAHSFVRLGTLPMLYPVACETRELVAPTY